MTGALRILGETRIGMDRVCEMMGPEGEPCHLSTAYKAMKVGRLAPDGRRVFLAHLNTGGRLITSVEAVGRYLAALNGLDPDDAGAVDPALDAVGV
jgi:hypothetical protein